MLGGSIGFAEPRPRMLTSEIRGGAPAASCVTTRHSGRGYADRRGLVSGPFRSRKTGPREATPGRKWAERAWGAPRSAILQRSEPTSEGPGTCIPRESLKNPCRDSGTYGHSLIYRSPKRFKQGAMEFFRPSLDLTRELPIGTSAISACQGGRYGVLLSPPAWRGRPVPILSGADSPLPGQICKS